MPAVCMPLQVASILLSLFFFYDIFMVFISPVLFKSSVMLDVATAGQTKPVSDQACYCRLHPHDTVYCGPGELMPILFVIPRLGDYRYATHG